MNTKSVETRSRIQPQCFRSQVIVLAETIASSTSVLKENTFHILILDRLHGHLTKNNFYIISIDGKYCRYKIMCVSSSSSNLTEALGKFAVPAFGNPGHRGEGHLLLSLSEVFPRTVGASAVCALTK